VASASSSLTPDPAQSIIVHDQVLDANPGRPGAPISIPRLKPHREELKRLNILPTLRKLCEELSRKTGHIVVFGGTVLDGARLGSPSANRLLQAHIQQHSVNQPAREIFRQMYTQVGSTDCWLLFYDSDSNQFWAVDPSVVTSKVPVNALWTLDQQLSQSGIRRGRKQL
jgi:hypothetical protein